MKIASGTMFLSSLILLGCSQSPSQNATASAKNTTMASGHTAAASANGVAVSGQVASGAVALPLKVVGALGTAADKTGNILLDASGISKPLPVSDDTVSAGPAPTAE